MTTYAEILTTYGTCSDTTSSLSGHEALSILLAIAQLHDSNPTITPRDQLHQLAPAQVLHLMNACQHASLLIEALRGIVEICRHDVLAHTVSQANELDNIQASMKMAQDALKQLRPFLATQPPMRH